MRADSCGGDRRPAARPARHGGADRRWEQSTHSYFRDRIHVHAAEIEEAYNEPDKDRSVVLWQDIFGDGFKAPAQSSSSAKFPVVAPETASTVGRSGRAG